MPNKILERHKEEIKNIFNLYHKLEVFENAKNDDFKKVDDDLYFFDPQQKMNISLGNMGDGWICLLEGFFA
jgi:hypothetical protein